MTMQVWQIVLISALLGLNVATALFSFCLRRSCPMQRLRSRLGDFQQYELDLIERAMSEKFTEKLAEWRLAPLNGEAWLEAKQAYLLLHDDEKVSLMCLLDGEEIRRLRN